MSFIKIVSTTTKSVANSNFECKEKFYTVNVTPGQQLAEWRKAARLTQVQLAERCGISANYVSALERDEPNALDGSPRRPRLTKVDRMAKVLRVPVDEMRVNFGYAPAKPFTKPATIEELAPKFLLNIPIHLRHVCISRLDRKDVPRREVNFHPR